MSDGIQILLEMYKTQVERSAHYEQLRSAFSRGNLLIATGLVGLSSIDPSPNLADALLGSAIILLGLFGFICSSAHGLRSQRHGCRAAAYRDEIDRLLPTAQINKIRDSVSVGATRLNSQWNGLHIGISTVGAGLLAAGVAGEFDLLKNV